MLIQANTIEVVTFGQHFCFRAARIFRKAADLPEDTAAIGLGLDLLILADDRRLKINLITCHDVASLKQMNKTKWSRRYDAR